MVGRREGAGDERVSDSVTEAARGPTSSTGHARQRPSEYIRRTRQRDTDEAAQRTTAHDQWDEPTPPE